jgi:hypothetical protein
MVCGGDARFLRVMAHLPGLLLLHIKVSTKPEEDQ